MRAPRKGRPCCGRRGKPLPQGRKWRTKFACQGFASATAEGNPTQSQSQFEEPSVRSRHRDTALEALQRVLGLARRVMVCALDWKLLVILPVLC